MKIEYLTIGICVVAFAISLASHISIRRTYKKIEETYNDD